MKEILLGRKTGSQQIAELGIYPAVDPLASTSRILGEEHYGVARNVKENLQRNKDLQDIIAMWALCGG